jgi:hypothetical protein
MRSLAFLRNRNVRGLQYPRAIQQLRACRPIPENQVRELCYKARELLIEEGNVVGVDAPVTVCMLSSPDGAPLIAWRF